VGAGRRARLTRDGLSDRRVGGGTDADREAQGGTDSPADDAGRDRDGGDAGAVAASYPS